jgi:ABC-type bacteriocin/lantibiotic exporter with double-glycine peptidase domain
MARVVKSFKYSNGTNLNFQKTDQNVTDYLKARTAHFKVLLTQYRALVVFKVLIIAGLLIIGTLLLINNKMNIGAFVAAEIAIVAVVAAVEKLMSSLESLYDAFTSLEKIDYVLDSSVETTGTLLYNTAGRGVHLQIKDLSFGYNESEAPVLKNINVEIPSNARAAIIGMDGAGKTSLLKVLTGSYQNFSGNILVNDIPLKNFELDSYRNRIGIYLNNMEVFKGTLRENITLGRMDISLEEILSLIQRLGFKNFMDQFEQGFDTPLEPLGKRWSSTILRQIMLLRAFCVKGELLLMEEPWQGMDDEFKNNIIRFLCEELKNTTVVIISNDAKYLANCQTIIHL